MCVAVCTCEYVYVCVRVRVCVTTFETSGYARQHTHKFFLLSHAANKLLFTRVTTAAAQLASA